MEPKVRAGTAYFSDFRTHITVTLSPDLENILIDRYQKYSAWAYVTVSIYFTITTRKIICVLWIIMHDKLMHTSQIDRTMWKTFWEKDILFHFFMTMHIVQKRYGKIKIVQKLSRTTKLRNWSTQYSGQNNYYSWIIYFWSAHDRFKACDSLQC